MVHLSLQESKVFSDGYDSIDMGAENTFSLESSPALYHLFEAGAAIRANEVKLGTWDEINGVWIKDKM